MRDFLRSVPCSWAESDSRHFNRTCSYGCDSEQLGIGGNSSDSCHQRNGKLAVGYLYHPRPEYRNLCDGSLSCIGTSRTAKRAAVIHLLFNVFGTVIFGFAMFFIFIANPAFASSTADSVGISVFHTIFNITNTVLLFPFAGLLVKASDILVRKGTENRYPRWKQIWCAIWTTEFWRHRHLHRERRPRNHQHG